MKKTLFSFSPRRFASVVVKEFIQMRRDRMTFAMMVGIPVLQLVIFGYAINSNPKFLPTVIVEAGQSNFTRAIVSAMKNSEYFSIVKEAESEDEAEKIMKRAEAQFVISFPPDFSRELAKGKRPQLLIQADAADPSAVSYALSAFEGIVNSALAKELKGPLAAIGVKNGPVDIRLHRCFNPEIRTQVNVVPGLLGVILTMTMVFITSLAVTREKERGTMETLLATPVKPLEVMTGKIIPYMIVGYIQITLVLGLAKYLFNISFAGSISLLFFVAFFFIAANLAVGVTISTLAKNQLQAVQMSVFFFLPSILLSGFMFPFRGMPFWAQCIGSMLPLTHFLEIVRGIILRGAGLGDFYRHGIFIVAFLFGIILIGLFRYRQTLD
ncbi:MAG: mannose-1-phosphate guanyltransferase [Lentisphaerae bacterium GWF2_44_16]|nr:MAG: mannose-1-phosphate guanyltransferase [Lentisphaerae bacterium GWF2_44_16]